MWTQAVGPYKAFDSFRVPYIVKCEDDSALILEAIIDGLNDIPTIQDTLRAPTRGGRVIREGCQ